MMKRAAKAWLMAAAALVSIGILGFVGVLAWNHWDFSKLGAKLETRTVDVDEAFQSISIRSDTEDISILPSDDGKCSVVFYERKNVRHTAAVQDGTLTIGVIDERSWYEHLVFSFGSPKMMIYLPRNEYASLSIQESTGDIAISSDFTFGSMTISVRTGDVDCGASATGPVRIESSTGDIRLEGASAGELDLSVSTGRIEVRSVTCEGDVGMTVSTGKTELAEIACRRLSSSGSTGAITLHNVIAEESISIERSTGDVRLERCDAAELFIQTDTGDVTGSLLSEKVFIARSDTGRVEVPETTGGGKCKIITDTGDIVITLP